MSTGPEDGRSAGGDDVLDRAFRREERERLELLLGERLEGRDPEELIRSHPELAEDLQAHFAAMDALTDVFSRDDASATGAPPVVGDFRILREVGRGGMGVVYEAEQVSMGRRVALKVLSPSVVGTPQALTRFRREARAAGQIHHTSIVPVFAMGEDKGYSYYAMELVDGPPLSEVIARERDEGDGRRRRRSWYLKLAEAFAGVAEGLDAAHEEGVIHRDVKPANLLSTDGTLKLVDFGLARLSGEGASMTLSGQVLGTPHYMSPEQARARGLRIDHRTDVYSLGATLYEALTLTPPFTGESVAEVCSQIVSRDPVSLRKHDPRIPKDLETIVLKAMEKDRGRRYASALELAKDLRRFAEGLPIKARRVGPVGRAVRRVKRKPVRAALVAAVVVLIVAGTLLGLRAPGVATAD